MAQLWISDYTKSSYAVIGNINIWKNELSLLGGIYRPNLSPNPGYLFNKKNVNLQLLQSFVRLVNYGIINPGNNNNIELAKSKQQPLDREFMRGKDPNPLSQEMLKYQTIQYYLPLPYISQQIVLDYEGNKYTYYVDKITHTNNFVSEFIIRSKDNNSVLDVIIKEGRWSVNSLDLSQHSLYF